MAELIQFSCPACGATLRLPLAMAGQRGPCPLCGTEIVAPDPARGLGARAIPSVSNPTILEPIQPFADPPDGTATEDAAVLNQVPVLSVEPPKAIVESPPPVAPAESHRPKMVPELERVDRSQGAVLVLSVLLATVVSLAIGYLLGARSNWLIAQTPYPVMPALESNQPEKAEVKEPVVAEPKEKPADEIPESAPPPEVPAEDSTMSPLPDDTTEANPVPEDEGAKKASDLAQAALKAFLESPDWASRSAYVLKPDVVRSAMEAYSRQKPDGPTPYQSVSLEDSYTDKKTGFTLFIFKVVTEIHPSGFPAAVAETSNGWNIDWQSFVEFRDDHFRVFADGPAERNGRFHLRVRQPTKERAVNTDNEHFASFLIEPPLPGRQRLAYVRKGTETQKILSAATADGSEFWPVLEVGKKKAPDERTFLEIESISAENWIPEI